MDITKQLLDEIVAQYATQEWSGGFIEKDWEDLQLRLIDLDYKNTDTLLAMLFEKQQYLLEKHQLDSEFDPNNIFLKSLGLLSEKVYDHFWGFVYQTENKKITDEEKMKQIDKKLTSMSIFSLSVISYVKEGAKHPFEDYIFERLQFHLQEYKTMLQDYETAQYLN